MLLNRFVYLMTSAWPLLSFSEDRAVDVSSKPNWIMLEGGAQIKGIQVGRYFSSNFGVEAGYLNYRPLTWRISDSRNTISIFSAMLRGSYGLFRAGAGPAFRKISGSERCKFDTFDPVTREIGYTLGPTSTWEIQTIDVQGTFGLLWPTATNFQFGFNVITWGRQVALYSFEMEHPDTMSDDLIEGIERKLRKDTYTVMTVTAGFAF
ncbi:MAG TPA: hypothetical protein VE954_24305 [Oligoflexus sp.]|uniref:hypothetical protein n=1 Tax=Oligoflexus sp. TaxID=1971216 RepID=UPI002D575D10|nr:hypothetical protein [Oligoflexus sp.]HYX36238.1 hypothetical protein [Oligoflexus sp.]